MHRRWQGDACLLPEAAKLQAVARQSFYRFTPKTLGSREELLAELEEIRTCGHAFDREEHEPGIICLAVPVLSSGGSVLGALSVTSTTTRNSLDGLEQLAPQLQACARHCCRRGSLAVPGKQADLREEIHVWRLVRERSQEVR
ncbi:IclR family transcriptional regulator C-terminal domain-containing protein [Pannonibacter sp. Pt2-lr]